VKSPPRRQSNCAAAGRDGAEGDPTGGEEGPRGSRGAPRPNFERAAAGLEGNHYGVGQIWRSGTGGSFINAEFSDAVDAIGGLRKFDRERRQLVQPRVERNYFGRFVGHSIHKLTT
jgi:hypothetical protein